MFQTFHQLCFGFFGSKTGNFFQTTNMFFLVFFEFGSFDIYQLDLAIEVPARELGPVASHEMWDEIYNRVADLVRQHRSTLVFVNTRRLAERVAHHLEERLGKDAVATHHGSLSRKLRFAAENKLKSGEIQALVATASLELGFAAKSANPDSVIVAAAA